ncbi:urate hydroxylase PuuD [Phaeovulum sp.]|uniref:urate hydroxylase PuuD n=1 Tax=Phaeovulum sp. TaxID=2934796 RepID=UPI0027320E4B|nr:urate hydroxylase PuuD [Phaeovulum sp.]MDP1669858.1 urate hydroxylase PuuD [Phaeovulum sp.]MDP2062749.1 urate hydroxylase PuuD [Phaeovulum sp.]MDZ4118570.1 urate hydroxylase PuuD [Phaeovulum sp.]
MLDWTFVLEWGGFALRWLHVVTAIAWIGSSFYFIALDLGLHPEAVAAAGVKGAAWQVHGGGFYHIRKYLVAPAELPAQLTWFKWESYATWLSGFAMLVLVYYLGAEFYLIDPAIADLTVWQAVAISLGSLGFGWLAYDAICRSAFGRDNTRLMLGLYVILVGVAWGYTQVFTGRAALLHLGAFTATIMSANVFLVIIPNQRVVVADLIAGRVPDPKYGIIAKQRSTHNNYLTLPVVFLMLSNHYPLAFASDWNWLVASLVFLMGVTIRHWFNRRHAHLPAPWWTWAATLALGALMVWLSLPDGRGEELQEGAALPPAAARFAAAEGFDEVAGIVLGRCSMCHASEPGYPGIGRAPKAVALETPEQVARQAQRIYVQAGITDAMPPANLSFMEPAERAAIIAWYRSALRGPAPG